jgi:hypothetical protein
LAGIRRHHPGLSALQSTLRLNAPNAQAGNKRVAKRVRPNPTEAANGERSAHGPVRTKFQTRAK